MLNLTVDTKVILDCWDAIMTCETEVCDCNLFLLVYHFHAIHFCTITFQKFFFAFNKIYGKGFLLHDQSLYKIDQSILKVLGHLTSSL